MFLFTGRLAEMAVQAPMYLSQVINFSPIKNAHWDDGKGGFINLPHPSFLWHFTMYWLLVHPIARSRICAVNLTLFFFPRWLFCSGNKEDLLGDSVQNVEHSLLLPLHKTHQKTSWNPLPNTCPLPSVSLTTTALPSLPSAWVEFWIAFFTVYFKLSFHGVKSPGGNNG